MAKKKRRRSKAYRRYKARLALWTVLIAIVAVGGLILVHALRLRQKPAWEGGYGVRISEVMTDNVNCPDEKGMLVDYVEIENTSARDFDLGGYYLSDEAGNGKYLFPAGTKVPAHEYLLVWCDPMAESGYAPFGLKKEGGESVVLMNANRVTVDEAVTVPCASGQSLIRGEGGALVPTDTPSPGYPNDEAGARAWQEIVSERSGGALVLSEIMTSNSLYPGPDGLYSDWIEVYNPTDRPVALAGYKLSDREDKAKYDFPADRTLGSGEYMVIWCVTGGTGEDVASFALQSDGGETVVLMGPSSTAVDSVTLPALEKNHAYVRTASGWTETDRATPGYGNDDAGYQAYLSTAGYEDVPVYITEIMADSKAFCVDEDGDFSDWIELGNLGTETVDLTGWYLSDQEDLPNQWPIPSLTLAPGEHVRIWASGKNRASGGALHTNFALSIEDTVILATPAGTPMRSAKLSDVPKGSSLVWNESGEYTVCDYPSPGQANNGKGYVAFCEQDGRASPVLIWEAVVYDEDHEDWVELKNVSSAEVDLSGYTLTDKFKEPARMTLSGVLAPGETKVVELTGFGLNAQRDEIYLFDPNGRPCDWTALRNIPLPGSYGRMDGENGFFYFTSLTPGSANASGWRMVASAPTADVAPGVYREADSLLVTLSGEGIRYTTDGSTPTESSEAYTGPISITGTTILRARSFAPDQLPGDTATLSYFLHEESTLPVVSLVTDRSNLFGPTGLYDHHEEAWQGKWERPVTVSFFEEDGGFTIDCGVRIHGRVSRSQSDKRSMKLVFRGRYGGDLSYDVFGDGRVTEFSSLLLRGSLQDTSDAYITDALFADMAMDFTDVPAQNYRYVSLYINGEYWGIYSIREHHSEEYFASHYGVDPDTVQVFNGEYRYPGTFNDLLSYAEYHDLSTAESWQYIQEHMDVAEIIDWTILECWGGDKDVYENVRFYSSPEYKNNAVLYGLVDMDLCMYDHQTYAVGFESWPQLHAVIPRGLLGNAEFKDMFLTRLGELMRGPMSDENVLARIDALSAQVEPEAARDLQRWGLDVSTFSGNLSRLRTFATGRAGEMMDAARAYFGLSADQAQQYFG